MSASWDYGAVALLDILGFSSLVESDARSSRPKQLERLLGCMRDVKSSTPKESIDVRSFSDSIILSSPLTSKNVGDLIFSVCRLQRTFVKNGFLIRGAIAYGKHYLDDDSVYSEALIRAYKLERDHVRFPRVVVEGDLIDWYSNDPCTNISEKARIVSTLLRDRDGQVFIDYFEPDDAERHLQVIEERASGGLSASVVEKFQWLAAYHNHKCSELGIGKGITGHLVDGFKPFSVE